MGQRLNLEIVQGDAVLANAYYHWSGYTSSAFDLVKQIVDSGVYYSNIADPVEKAIRMLEVTGAGLTEDEFTEMYSPDKFATATSRNTGLIAISKTGIEETRRWEEANITIDISTGSIDTGGVFYLIDEYEEQEEQEESVELANSLVVDITKFQELYEEITNLNTYRIKVSEHIFMLIE